jgi:hypothetical protein
MRSITRGLARALLVVALTVATGLAQQSAPEKHVRDVRVEQTQKVIAASGLCQRVRADGHSYIHHRVVTAPMLETDLPTLMQNSDTVILASLFTDQMDALAPSGEDAIEYYDVKVLRAWKGSYKAGDLVTFELPRGGVYCGLKPIGNGVANSGAVTSTGGSDWHGGRGTGPYVLFLRQSRGDEMQLTPGLRLAGGDGLQGMFALGSKYDRDCAAVLPGGAEKCSAALDASQEAVKVPYHSDPLKTKYEGRRVPDFLKEVQSTADALGHTTAAK